MIEMLIEQSELHRAAEEDLAACRSMPPSDGVRAAAIEIAEANVAAHRDRLEVLMIACGLFGIEPPRPPDAPQ